MTIYPLSTNGVCVRLKMGDMQQAAEYGDPAEIAAEWQRQGAGTCIWWTWTRLSRKFCNRNTVARILKPSAYPVQLGGGMPLADIEERLKMGINRVIIGTAAIENPIWWRRRLRGIPATSQRG